MGSEFLKKTRATYVKSIDIGRVRLGTPTLFTQIPKDRPRCAVATLSDGAKVVLGDTLIIEPKGVELVASRGNVEVARIKNPPPSVMLAICKSGVAKGEIQKINKLSKTADISLC